MTQENPFVFGRAAEGTYYTDRTEDAKRLTANLTYGINTILISPRRWGDDVACEEGHIDIDGQNISFNDSLFKLWLKRQKFYE